MSVKVFKRVEPGGALEPGEYAKVKLDGKWTAAAACPGCGLRTFMSDHEIDDQGRVTPSVGCAADCGYHEVGVVLEDWSR